MLASAIALAGITTFFVVIRIRKKNVRQPAIEKFTFLDSLIREEIKQLDHHFVTLDLRKRSEINSKHVSSSRLEFKPIEMSGKEYQVISCYWYALRWSVVRTGALRKEVEKLESDPKLCFYEILPRLENGGMTKWSEIDRLVTQRYPGILEKMNRLFELWGELTGKGKA